MSKRLFLVLLVMICLFFEFAFKIEATPTDQSLVSFSSGALVIEKAPEYSPKWGSIMIMDENPTTGWCSPQGKILDNVIVIELAEKSVLEGLEFGTGYTDKKGRGAKDIIVELSDDGSREGFVEIASVSLADQEDRQSFPVKVDKSGKWLRLTIKNNHGDSEYTELMEFRAYGKQLTKTPLADVSGTYKTNYNDFHLRQEGTSVTGCYEWNEGILDGGIEDQIMKFTWIERDQRGPAIMIFTSWGAEVINWSKPGREKRITEVAEILSKWLLL